jgi:biopolymer transport protein ExbD
MSAVAGHFEKKSADAGDEGIPTSSLPDIIFMLLIFFMVSTVMRQTDVKVKTTLPQAESLEKIEQKRLISYVYIGPKKQNVKGSGQTGIQVDDALINDVSNIQAIMERKVKNEPRLIVSLKVDENAESGILRDVEKELRQANALRINYASSGENQGS